MLEMLLVFQGNNGTFGIKKAKLFAPMFYQQKYKTSKSNIIM
jgi:hypothetical protein